eukprot:scaffold625690_cov52-Prasinocladus_malaysianus.AAC.1
MVLKQHRGALRYCLEHMEQPSSSVGASSKLPDRLGGQCIGPLHPEEVALYVGSNNIIDDLYARPLPNIIVAVARCM